MGIRCFTRKRKDGSNYVNCIEINEGQRAIGNNLIPRQEQERGLGNNLLALEAPPPLRIGGNREDTNRMRDMELERVNRELDMIKQTASNVKDEIRRNMKERALDEMTNEEKREEIRRLERELEM